MIHYHGTPLTPRETLYRMAGKHFCVSFADKRDGDVCLDIGQSVMWDNGAFTAFTKGKPLQLKKYYEWLESRMGHPHWAVVPDVISGSEDDNYEMLKQWPHRKELSAVVWHLGDSFNFLHKLLDSGFAKICFGSSGDYWQVGSPKWSRRCDEAFNEIIKVGNVPWIHMLRGNAQGGKRWPFASADSAYVARSYKDTKKDPELMARKIDRVQTPVFWKPELASPIQDFLL
jgi:hypothetical protein